MNIAERRLVMLVLDNGKCPLQEWLEEIRDKTTRARIQRQRDKLSRDLGTQKGLQGIAELKRDCGPGYRIYYGFLDARTIVVLIGGGDKPSQSKDIADARQLWVDFTKGGTPEVALRAWKQRQGVTEEGEEDEPKEF